MSKSQRGPGPGPGRPTEIEEAKRLTIWLPLRDIDRIDEIAAEHSLTRSRVIRHALARGLRWLGRKTNTDT